MAFGFADPFQGRMMPLSYRMMQAPQVPEVQAPKADPLAFIPKVNQSVFKTPQLGPVAPPSSSEPSAASSPPADTAGTPTVPGAPAVPGAAAGAPAGAASGASAAAPAAAGGSGWSQIFSAILGML